MVLTTGTTSNRAAGTSTSGARKSTARPSLAEERKLWKAGCLTVAGLDEVGRGAWAGPVTVGVAVVRSGITTRNMSPWLRDSKQLSEDRREAVFEEIGAWCQEWAVGHAEAEECDRWGMTAALRLASLRALSLLSHPPDAVLVDGPYDLLAPAPSVQLALDLGVTDASSPARTLTDRDLPVVDLPGQVVPVVGGDARCASIAAASVLAKVVRDRLMRANAVHFPAFSFERNKGYPSPVHQTALRGYGLSSIHRRSWSYVGDLPWSDGAPRPA